jgi:hypothetical protein
MYVFYVASRLPTTKLVRVKSCVTCVCSDGFLLSRGYQRKGFPVGFHSVSGPDGSKDQQFVMNLVFLRKSSMMLSAMGVLGASLLENDIVVERECGN